MADHPERRHSLRKSQLIDFPNVAAGHDGVKASQSGDLIVKPCKNSEVHFYQQSWKPDPDPSEFVYYMPKFYGTLNLQETATSPLSTQARPQSPPVHPGITAAQTQIRPSSPNPTAGHARNNSRTIISHLPVAESFAPTPPPKKWEPSHGTKIEAENSVVLENVASDLVKPNILDIKIGARLWADDAVPDKRSRLDKVASETTSGSLGFRIAGMKIWAGPGAFENDNRAAMDKDHATKESQEQGPAQTGTAGTTQANAGFPPSVQPISSTPSLPRPKLREDDYASYERDYGRALSTSTVRQAFEEYFYRPASTGIHHDHADEVIARFVEDLKGLQMAMEGQETRMYSASLLFVYEGDGVALRESFRKENRMIREAREAAEQEVEIETAEEGAGPGAAGAAGPLSTDAGTKFAGLTLVPGTEGIPSASLDHSAPAPLVMQDLQTPGEHDGDDDGGDDDDEEDPETKLPKIQSLKVIDFAHANWTPGQGPDENFLIGLRNVIKILEEMLNDNEA